MIRDALGGLLVLAAVSLGADSVSAQVTQGSMIISCAELADVAARLACFDALAQAAVATQRGPIPAFLFDWQTMIAGIFALAAAFFSVRAVRTQIQVAREQENERLKRRQAAARSTLPLTLTEVMAFAKRCADELQKVRSLPESEGHLAEATMTPFRPPEIPQGLVVGLDRMIEASPAGAIRDTLADINDRMQVVSARLSEVPPGQRLNSGNFWDYVVDAAEIYTLAASLFDYARRSSERPTYPAAGVHLHASLRRLGFDEDRGPDRPVFDNADRRENGTLMQALRQRSCRR